MKPLQCSDMRRRNRADETARNEPIISTHAASTSVWVTNLVKAIKEHIA
jgi:hypothetical protein